ncbi:unnamed protein product [Paramecium sonneborni]|uniref:Uncharacterized protein n=1 Tax=Paramecium sonneborni TaxID=65129 RepID=A0A8S1MRP8_9CILI|nr:unnamed protein product [Paramecium sonneborni]
MGCNVQKSKSQPNKLYQSSDEILEMERINVENQASTRGKKTDLKETQNLITQQPQIGNRLQNMTNNDELLKYINKRHSISQSPFGYIKNSPEQRRKQSLMNSPKL